MYVKEKDGMDIPEHVDCILFGRFYYLLLYVLVDWRFDCTHESSSCLSVGALVTLRSHTHIYTLVVSTAIVVELAMTYSCT